MNGLFQKRYWFVSVAALTIVALWSHSMNAQPGRSQVVTDRFDKQNMSGQVRIALAWGQQLSPPQNLQIGMINLKDAMNKYTNIQTSMDSHLQLSDPNIVNYPFVFVTTDKTFELTETERQNLRRYFDNGGFMFLDNPNQATEIGAGPLRKLLTDTLPNVRFERILNSHELYSCFFDFPDGPPRGSEGQQLASGLNPNLRSREISFLEGVTYKGRLVAVYSDKGYINMWANYPDSEPPLKMGVNLIVYALTH